MNKRNILTVIVIASILILLGLWLSNSRQNFDWRPSFRSDSQEPYGAYVIRQLLGSYYAGQPLVLIDDELKTELPATDSGGANYVFIGEGLFMDSLDTRRLLDFVAAGNRAFISSRTIPFDLMFDLYYEECYNFPWNDYDWIKDTLVQLNLEHPNLKSPQGFFYKHIDQHQTTPYSWQYIDEVYFCEMDYSPVALGQLNDSLTNFARISYGEGQMYLHTTPIAFANINMLEEESLSYANKVFSHLHPGPVYWDEYSKVSEVLARSRNPRQMPADRGLSSNSPLQYILSQPPLAWAWYLLLSLGLLYLIFRTRRRQRIIPVLEKNNNTSLEFINTIGSIYFMQNNHRKLALQQMKFFKAHVREHYHMQTRATDEDFVRTLAARSEVPEEKIRKILLMHSNIEQSGFLSEKSLIDFHRLIDYFYKNSK